MTIFDKLSGNITDEQGRHHWTWFANNGKSAEENYMIQKAEMHRAFQGKDDFTNVMINVETEVKK